MDKIELKKYSITKYRKTDFLLRWLAWDGVWIAPYSRSFKTAVEAMKYADKLGKTICVIQHNWTEYNRRVDMVWKEDK